MGNLVWLASYPKSGNTWLRAFLHNLFRVPERPYDINRLTDLCLSEAAVKWYRRFDDRPPEQWSDTEVMAMRGQAQRLMAATTPAEVNVFVKTHNALVSYLGRPLISQELTAGTLYVVRDPRDVAISFADHNGWTIDEAIGVMAGSYRKPTTSRNVVEIYGSWSEHVTSWTQRPHPGLAVIRYEDLLADPLAGFGRVAQFLQVPFTRARLEQAVKASSFAELQAQEQAAGFKERSERSARFFRVGRAGQWRQVLTGRQAAAVETAHAEQMARFGYAPAAGG